MNLDDMFDGAPLAQEEREQLFRKTRRLIPEDRGITTTKNVDFSHNYVKQKQNNASLSNHDFLYLAKYQRN